MNKQVQVPNTHLPTDTQKTNNNNRNKSMNIVAVSNCVFPFFYSTVQKLI